MTLQLDRTEIEPEVGVLGFIPQPNVEETMTWVTQIFRSSERGVRNEERTSVTPYPAITIDYQYLLSCGKIELIEMVRDHPNPVFFIPLYHQMQPVSSFKFTGTNRSMFNFTVEAFPDPGPGYFPFHQFLAIVGRHGSVVYKMVDDSQIAERNSNIWWELTLPITPAQRDVLDTDNEYYVAPVAKAYIDRRSQFDIPGGGRDGGTMRVLFRLDSEWERELSYAAECEWERFAQTPLVLQQNRSQVDWVQPTEISRSLAYVPYAKTIDNGLVHVVDYFLPTNRYRRDYGFRGNLMLNRGSDIQDRYIYRGIIETTAEGLPFDHSNVYRLEDDRVVITYMLGRAMGQLRLLEVDERYDPRVGSTDPLPSNPTGGTN